MTTYDFKYTELVFSPDCKVQQKNTKNFQIIKASFEHYRKELGNFSIVFKVANGIFFPIRAINSEN